MSTIYLINVGANLGHKSIARSPIFRNGTFVYVPFPHPGRRGARSYPKEARPFVRGIDVRDTHCDPDWDNLTYGTNIGLKHVIEDDILLYWALLWNNTGDSWEEFTGDRGWYLIGALRVREIFEPGMSPEESRYSRYSAHVDRARRNVHFADGRVLPGNRVFIGGLRFSRRFGKAVYFEAGEPGGLMFRTVRTQSNAPLTIGGSSDWRSNTRIPRPAWNLDKASERRRARTVRDAILSETRFDLLKNIAEM